ncbi:MAG: Lrp/AsnC family transcriptional regulator [Bacillota bacterium]|jgi:Lrp/AsnC family leucine-responsive transcriptional regulator
MGQLDKVDRQILDALSQDARMSMAEIGRRVHMSRVAVRARVKRLIDEGVIQEFTTVVDSSALGYDVHAFFEIEVIPNQIESVARALARTDQVTVVYQMTGSGALHVHAFLKDTRDLAVFLREHIYSIPGVVKVSSDLLLQRFKSVLSVR